MDKNINGFKIKYGGNIYAGNINGFNYLIKYDNTSLVYNLYFNILGKEDIKDLSKEIKKINKDITIIYKNNVLSIVGSLREIKDLAKVINPILENITKYLKDKNYKEICKHCKEIKKVYLTDNEGEINYFCDDCYKEFIKIAEYKKNNSKNVKEHTFKGIVGAIIGIIPGILLWLLLSYLKLEPGIAGIFITMGAALGFKHFGKVMKVSGLVISIIIGLLGVLIAHELNCSIYIYNLYKTDFLINLWDAYKSIPYYLSRNNEFKESFTNALSIGLILSIIGIFSSYSLYRQSIYTYQIKRIGE